MDLRIGAVDTAIIVVYVLAVVAFGFWIGRGQKGLSDFAVGGRSLPWWALLVSIVATETSTATFLSVPGLAFKEGGNLTFLQLAFGYVIGRYLVAWLILPLFFAGDMLTSYQVLESRFGPATRKLTSGLFVVTRTLADGLRLYLAALALQVAVGLDLNLAVVVMGVATVVYTFAGGIKAVVWTDFVQFLVYVVGGLVALAFIVGRFDGGAAGLLDWAQARGKLQVIDVAPADFAWTRDGVVAFLSQSYVLPAGVIGGLFVTLGTHGTDQLTVQRLLSARNRGQAWWALTLSGWVVLVQFLLFLFVGVALAAHYDGVRTFEANDKVFATFIVEVLPVGVRGILLAAVFSAAMSTLSSSLNSSATALVNDLVLPLRPTADAGTLRLTQAATVLFGVLQMAVAMGLPLLATELAASVVDGSLKVQGFTTGVILGLFLLGLLAVRVRPAAGLTAFGVGLTVLAAVAFFTPVAWPWYPVIGSAVVVAVGLTLIAILGPKADRPL